METQIFQTSMSPRAVKLLVEAIIGIIGLLGMMLAQAVEPDALRSIVALNESGVLIPVGQDQISIFDLFGSLF